MRSPASYTLCAVLVMVGAVALPAASCSPGEGSGASVYSGGSAELRGTAFTQPIPRPSFTFPDTDGQPYDFTSRTRGKLTFLFFGYTSCPDVCPVHMASLAGALAELPVEELARVEVVFVTVDPERDTPERLRTWLDSFSPRFVGLIPTLDEANGVLAEMYMAGAAHVPNEQGDGYEVVHPAAVIAFSPDGPARVRYGFGTRRADWAHDLPLLLGVQ